jgi:hypothetical protein
LPVFEPDFNTSPTHLGPAQIRDDQPDTDFASKKERMSISP